MRTGYDMLLQSMIPTGTMATALTGHLFVLKHISVSWRGLQLNRAVFRTGFLNRASLSHRSHVSALNFFSRLLGSHDCIFGFLFSPF